MNACQLRSNLTQKQRSKYGVDPKMASSSEDFVWLRTLSLRRDFLTFVGKTCTCKQEIHDNKCQDLPTSPSNGVELLNNGILDNFGFSFLLILVITLCTPLYACQEINQTSLANESWGFI